MVMWVVLLCACWYVLGILTEPFAEIVRMLSRKIR
jgi:hypothetical protein